jgi:DNA-binding GntR family transcriptional regulator
MVFLQRKQLLNTKPLRNFIIMTQESVNIFAHLLENILHDEIPEGEQLQTELELAKKFKTNRTNASSAVRMLEKRMA